MLYKKEQRKYFNEIFFEVIDSEIKAYLLGFIFADGCVIERHRGSKKGHEYGLRVNVAEKDKNIVFLLQQFIFPYIKIRIKKESIIEVGYLRKPQYEISLYSKKLFTDLCNLGCYPRKTYLENHIPDISEELKIHFIRGYFDGDGSASNYLKKTTYLNKKIYTYNRTAISIVSKTNNMLIEIQDIFNKYNIRSSVRYSNSKKYFELNICDNRSKQNLFYLLYKDSEYFFRRKFNEFKKINMIIPR